MRLQLVVFLWCTATLCNSQDVPKASGKPFILDRRESAVCSNVSQEEDLKTRLLEWHKRRVTADAYEDKLAGGYGFVAARLHDGRLGMCGDIRADKALGVKTTAPELQFDQMHAAGAMLIGFRNVTNAVPNSLDSTVRMFIKDRLIPNPPTHNDEQIISVSGRPVKSSAGEESLLKAISVLHSDGKIWDGMTEGHAPIPAEDRVVKVLACADWTLLLTSTPKSYGINPVYQWNPEPPEEGTKRLPPVLVYGSQGAPAQWIGCGGAKRRTVAAVINWSGELWTWGVGKHGALGHGDTKGKTHPKLVKGLEGKYITAAAVGDGFMVAATSDNELYGWGSNSHGQLGLAPEMLQSATTPTKASIDRCLR